MNILDILYTIFIGPLKLLFEVVYALSYHFTNNAGISIVLLSLVLNFLLMPLYKKADAIQDEENATQNKLKPGVDHIKKAFKGDEQFMVLQAYYRQNNYKPIYALRNSISLLLEIPFFVAAYSFLSDLFVLQGASFLAVKDLGSPDGLLFGLNLLPILMTAINVVSCIVYTKGQPIRARIQLYLMAALFLVLLYNSPSGLALYYTLNNIFSLIKNIINKFKNKGLLFGIIFSSVGALLLALVFIKFSSLSLKIKAVLLFVSVLLVFLGVYCFKFKKLPSINVKNLSLGKMPFELGCIVLCVLTGLLIPSAVINASPEEFVNSITLTNPIVYIINAFALAFGTFIIWCNVFYSLMEDNIKQVFNFLFAGLAIIALFNYLFFGNNFGNISNTLVYDYYPEIKRITTLINVVGCLVLFVVVCFVLKKKEKIANYALTVLSVSLLLMSTLNLVNINKATKVAIDKIEANKSGKIELTLSNDKQNVIVIMLDRAISYYIPFMLEEKPELKEQFDGFTYYPNTISFGKYTNTGSPALFGGYEYTPEEINKRTEESLCDKQNEALKVMPVLFESNNYNVTVCDPPYAGYDWIPDLSIYDEYQNIRAYITEGMFDMNGEYSSNPLEQLNRNLFCYSVTKVVPNALFLTTYNHGNYLRMEKTVKEKPLETNNIAFDESFAALRNYTKLTKIADDDKNGSFLMLQNSATHEPVLLQTPDYLPYKEIHNEEYNAEHSVRYSVDGNTLSFADVSQENHYHVNIASILELGKWFDYLKDNNAYDNTRIIVVSDHGRDLHLEKDLFINGDDLLFYNALLMVKDFNAHGISTDDTMMTVGDVPYLAMNGVINDMTNPFTNKVITKNEEKTFNVFATDEWETSINNGNTFLPGPWYSVHDNLFDINNWNVIEDPNS